MKPPRQLFWVDAGKFEPYMDSRGRLVKYMRGHNTRKFTYRRHAEKQVRVLRQRGYPNARLFEATLEWSEVEVS